MNLKKISTNKRIEDAQRIEDFLRSGGSGSLRSSLFNRQDEALTDEIQKVFTNSFKKAKKEGLEGGAIGNKQVMQFYVTIPDKVSIGNTDALLAKVNYNKDTKTFNALYRPKNGKWGQGQAKTNQLDKKR